MLLRILLLKELGIDEQLVVKRLREHPFLMQHAPLQQKHPECVAEHVSNTGSTASPTEE